MPKFRPDPSFRLRDIAEKQVPAKLKPIEVLDGVLTGVGIEINDGSLANA